MLVTRYLCVLSWKSENIKRLGGGMVAEFFPSIPHPFQSSFTFNLKAQRGRRCEGWKKTTTTRDADFVKWEMNKKQ